MGNHPETLEQAEPLTARLEGRLDALEQRVTALELSRARPNPAQTEALSQAESAQAGQPTSAPVEFPAVSSHGPAVEAAAAAEGAALFGAFPVMGAALLGIAGAYMLRAVSGANPVWRGWVAVIAALYAAGWLVAAARVHKRQFAATVYAGTSLLVLAPMLWEMTQSFRAMSPGIAATVLAAFAALALVLRRRTAGPGLGFVLFGLACTGLVLSIATHRMAEFSAVLLAMYGASVVLELVRVLQGGLAFAADAAVWTLLLVYRLPAAERTDYPAVASWIVMSFAAAVFLIPAVQLGWSTLKLKQCTTTLDALQSMLSLGIVLWALQWMLPAHGRFAAGVLCIVLAVCCAFIAYGPFRQMARRRNFHLFSIWAMALIAAGVVVVLPLETAAVAIALLGSVLMLQSRRPGLAPLAWHGLALLVAGALASGALQFGFDALAGPMPAAPSWAVATVIAMTVLLLAGLPEMQAERVDLQFAKLAPTLLAAYGVAALAVLGMTAALRILVLPENFHVAVIRTAVVCGVAGALAIIGARMCRRQMVRAAYCALAFVAAKLLFEDLRHGRLAFIAGSIFLVAITMIVVPRLARAGAQTKSEAPVA